MDTSKNLPILMYSDANGVHTVALEQASTSIGRLADQDVVLSESFVSRRHATIHQLDTGYELVDQNSSHGTYVNGTRVERVLLRAGDVLQFGSPNAPKLRFQLQTQHEKSAHSSPGSDLLSALSMFSLAGRKGRPALREMEHLNFLLNAARQLNAGEAMTDIFEALLQLSMQLTGVERGFVFLSENGEMRLELGLHADGTVLKEDSTVSRSAMQRAIESESKFSVSDTVADSDVKAWASVMANSIRCVYCIPLRKHVSAAEPKRLLGLLYLDSQKDAGHLSEIDHQLLDAIAMEAATLLDNALLAEAEAKARQAAEELAVAARIHASLMPAALPLLSYAELQAKAVPCLQIGGDFYDAVPLDDGLAVAIADVSGKGVPASIVAATLQGIIHAQMLSGTRLDEVAALVNRFLCARSVGKYATMVLLKLYPDGRVEYVNCGHVRPLLVSESEVRALEEANLIVGLIPGAAYAMAQCRVAPGERILLATDGITEAENDLDEQFGEARLCAAARLDRIEKILDSITGFQGSKPAQDDSTLLDIRYTG